MTERRYRSKPPSGIRRDSERQQSYIVKLESHGTASAGDLFCTNDDIKDSNILLTNKGNSDQELPQFSNECSVDDGYVTHGQQSVNGNFSCTRKSDVTVAESKVHVKEKKSQTDKPMISNSSQTESPQQRTCFTQCPNVKKQDSQTNKIITTAKKCQTPNPKYETTGSQCKTETCTAETMTELSVSDVSTSTNQQPNLCCEEHINILEPQEATLSNTDNLNDFNILDELFDRGNSTYILLRDTKDVT